VRRITVHATERAVEYIAGRFTRVLEPGRHARARRATYLKVTMSSQLSAVAPQDILTADGLTVRVTLAVRWQVDDPRTFLEAAQAPFDVVYLAAQVALREAVSALDSQALARRREWDEGLAEAVCGAAQAVGIDVLAVTVKDVILPAEVRAAYAELVTAQVRGEAQLAVARAETAALWSMANGAKLLDDHPALARLRLVQSLPAGATVQIVSP
jgi:regulator of protease activity HflC (stomatin/prohibitin superfamily)